MLTRRVRRLPEILRCKRWGRFACVQASCYACMMCTCISMKFANVVYMCIYIYYIHIFSQDKIVCVPTALHLGGAPSFLVHLSHWNWMLQGSWVSLVNLTEELVIGVDLCLDNESGVCVWDSALCLGEMLMKRQQLSGSSDSTVRSVTMHHSCSWSNMIIWSRMKSYEIYWLWWETTSNKQLDVLAKNLMLEVFGSMWSSQVGVWWKSLGAWSWYWLRWSCSCRLGTSCNFDRAWDVLVVRDEMAWIFWLMLKCWCWVM